MKNLNLFEVTTNSLKLDPNEEIAICLGYAEQTSSDLYVCSNLELRKFDENGNLIWSKELSNVLKKRSQPVNITFLSLNNSLCVGFASGELVTVDTSSGEFTLAGFCDGGLLALEWSPDQEQLVLVTKTLNMVLMSYSFDPLTEVSLLDQEFGDKQFITVGWGKKETQFHGSAGKNAAKKKDEIAVEPGVTDGTIKVTWRGDGQLYAVGFTMDGLRRFKVFDREGTQQYTSEILPGLQNSLAWRPSGNVIASTQILADKQKVVFFEKNGLNHGDFIIPVSTTTEVRDLTWSADSEILAIFCTDSVNNTDKILLFTTANYHWYLKQTLNFSSKKVSKILWDNDFEVVNNKKLHVLLMDGEFYSYTWIWNVDHSVGTETTDDAIVAVIDGDKVLVTGFRQTVVPPPMAALELQLDCQVNSVHFAPKLSDHIDSNSFFLCTNDNKLVFYYQTSKFPLQYNLFKTIKLEEFDFPMQYYNWKWINDSLIICIQIVHDCCNLLEYAIDSECLSLKDVTSLPSNVVQIHAHPTDPFIIYLHFNNGEIVEYTVGGSILPLDVSFPTACPKFQVVSLEDQIHFIALSHKGHFYIDGDLVMNNVSSIFVHTHFLLLTTLKHFLLTVELTEDGFEALKEFKKNESSLVHKRKIERGSKLVVVVPHDTRTVFQMPRGNLEAIQPRPLSLKIIGQQLDQMKYHDAFDLMRKQRINLNLIYDHDPDKFLENTQVFLNEINNNSWLSLFLSELDNVDVTKTMYSNMYSKERNNENINKKVDKVCDIVRDHIGSRSDKESKILPLLTAFVKKDTITDLETALAIIKRLKDQESAGSKLPVGSDEALKYLLYMVDVNKLFEVALGMYDFDLVILVANKSQKDPKEFLSMLNDFNEMEENYKRFSINKYLKRFDRAVECLAKCGPAKADELRSLVKYHSLYEKALSVLEKESELYSQISDDFGAYLILEKRYLEAGLVYREIKNYQKALESFRDALEWELAMEMAHKLPTEQFEEILSDVANKLQSSGRADVAATMLELYGAEPDRVVAATLLAGRHLAATRLCARYRRDDLLQSVVIPAIVSDARSLLSSISEQHADWRGMAARLADVRANPPPPRQHELCDTASNASTMSRSTGSTRSNASSRKSRRTARALTSTRRGTALEPAALVSRLHAAAGRAVERRRDVQQLCVAALSVGERNMAGELQSSMDNLLTDIKSKIPEVWNEEVTGGKCTDESLNLLEPHERMAPAIAEINWKLQILET